MGDRAQIVFYDRDKQNFSPAIYLHWKGHTVESLLVEAQERMRAGDPEYSAARFCGVCHEILPGNRGLGLNPPPTDWDEATSKDFSVGGAGTFLVNVDTGEVECFHGYGFSQAEGDTKVTLQIALGRA